MRLSSLSVLIALLVCVVHAAPAADLITNLPGLNQTVKFNQYAGYVDLPVDNPHKHMFYWFVESQNDPSSDPLVLWLNGGPGCSSLGGFLSENGPFIPGDDGVSLATNPDAWNRIANVLYLESPVSVGFSYSDNPSDYATDDAQTAEDNFHFLNSWFFLYPEYASHPLYITGESYAGHYIPTLVRRILQGNDNGESDIELAGFAVGNPTTNVSTDFFWGTYFTWYTHALISLPTWKGIEAECNHDYLNPSQACNNYLNAANTEMGNINPYDIDVPVCTSSQRVRAHTHRLAHKAFNLHVRAPPPYQPCEDSFLTDYLNRPDVRKAIHASPDVSAWVECNNSTLKYNITDFLNSMLPLYEYFLNETDLKVWVYSGDADTVVPFLGTNLWVNAINAGRPVLQPWQPWTLNQQVAGYRTVYDRMTFVTIRNAGHMVPETQPERGFALFSAFLSA